MLDLVVRRAWQTHIVTYPLGRSEQHHRSFEPTGAKVDAGAVLDQFARPFEAALGDLDLLRQALQLAGRAVIAQDHGLRLDQPVEGRQQIGQPPRHAGGIDL